MLARFDLILQDREHISKRGVEYLSQFREKPLLDKDRRSLVAPYT